MSRARVFQDMDNYDKAIADFNEAIRLRPNDALVHRSLALSFLMRPAPAVPISRRRLTPPDTPVS